MERRVRQTSYYYQILADDASNVQLKEVQIYEGQHSGGIWVREAEHREVGRGKYSWAWERGHLVEGELGLKWWSSELGFLRMLSKGEPK
jgi:hypothetical protein